MSEHTITPESGAFLGLTEANPDFLSGSTLMLFLNDGSRWHFTKNGHLVALEEDGFRTFYERDQSKDLGIVLNLMLCIAVEEN